MGTRSRSCTIAEFSQSRNKVFTIRALKSYSSNAAVFEGQTQVARFLYFQFPSSHILRLTGPLFFPQCDFDRLVFIILGNRDYFFHCEQQIARSYKATNLIRPYSFKRNAPSFTAWSLPTQFPPIFAAAAALQTVFIIVFSSQIYRRRQTPPVQFIHIFTACFLLSWQWVFAGRRGNNFGNSVDMQAKIF